MHPIAETHSIVPVYAVFPGAGSPKQRTQTETP